jgi:hypothetical protein
MTILEIEIEASRPVAARCSEAELSVDLADGRRVVTPLWWYPRLLAATPEERAEVELSSFGVHWPRIDEDLSIAGMLRGAKAPGATPPEVID